VTAVRIPPVLRSNVGGAKEVAVSGTTVGEALTSLVTQHPGLRDQLLTGDGELNRFVNVYLDGQDIRYLEELATPVAEHDQIIVLPAMAGG
jgi:molybdopterin synthase sulfur carrier subunit